MWIRRVCGLRLRKRREDGCLIAFDGKVIRGLDMWSRGGWGFQTSLMVALMGEEEVEMWLLGCLKEITGRLRIRECYRCIRFYEKL